MGNSLDRERYKVAIPQLENRIKTLEDSNSIIIKTHRETNTISANGNKLYVYSGIAVKGYEPLAVAEIETNGTNADKIFFYGWDFTKAKDILHVGVRNTHSSSVTATIVVSILYIARNANASLQVTQTTGGGGGSSNYNDLENKPQINSVTLVGNKNSSSLGLADSVHTHVIEDISDLETVTQLRDGLMTALDKQKLDGIASGAEVNVNADWNAESGDAQILNKPTIETYSDFTGATSSVDGTHGLVPAPSARSQPERALLFSDATWSKLGLTLANGSSTGSGGTEYGYILYLHKGQSSSSPILASAFIHDASTSERGLMSKDDKTKLDGIANGAEVNVQSDWNQSSTSADSYIKNKPSIPSKTSDLTNDSGFISAETDPVFTASDAYGITSADISSWNDKSEVSINKKTASGTNIFDITIDGTTTQIYAPTSGGATDYDQLTSRPQINSVTLTGNKAFSDLGLVDFFYPVGSYYETSDTTFDPNVSWGGTWSLETEGLVHIGGGANYTVGDTGGEATHVLTTDEMPSHTHTQNQHRHEPPSSTYDAFMVYNYTATSAGLGETRVSHATSGSRYAPTSTNSSFDASYAGVTGYATATNQNTGGGLAHENMQPYVVVNRWHRTA